MNIIARELKGITDLVISTMTGFLELDPFVLCSRGRHILDQLSSNLVVQTFFFKLGHVGLPKETNSLVFTTVIVFFAEVGGGGIYLNILIVERTLLSSTQTIKLIKFL